MVEPQGEREGKTVDHAESADEIGVPDAQRGLNEIRLERANGRGGRPRSALEVNRRNADRDGPGSNRNGIRAKTTTPGHRVEIPRFVAEDRARAIGLSRR
jgi:hypothetical protein